MEFKDILKKSFLDERYAFLVIVKSEKRVKTSVATKMRIVMIPT